MGWKWSAALLVLVACEKPPEQKPAPPPPPDAAVIEAPVSAAPKPLPNVQTDWCTAGLAGLDEETCYLAPPEGGRPRRVLLYLHGIIPPAHVGTVQKENVMASVKNAAERAGAAAIVPRGMQGVGPAGSKDWWAWPTSPEAHAKHGAELVKRILGAKAKLEDALGAPFAKTYLAGSSNGAYFAVNLALRGAIDVDGLGAMSGGAPAAIVRTKPLAVYVGYGRQDEASKRGGLALAKAAEAAGWKTKVAEHPFPHGAREVYIDEAFAFWDSVP